MTSAYDWEARVGRAWAEEWQRTDRTWGELTTRLLAAIAAEPGRHVLDVGCGAGEIALAVAAARSGAVVTGVDVSADLIEAAKSRGQGATFHHGDAGRFVDPAGAPDLLVSRHGVMFFADPPAVFRHLSAHAAPGARFVFSCFRARAENAWADLFAPLFPPAAPEPAAEFPAGPFAFADPAHVARCMAGWRDLQFQPVDFSYIAGSGDDPVAEAVALFSRIGPSAGQLALLDKSERPAMRARMAEHLRAHVVDGRIALPAAAWIVSATSDH